MKGKNATEAEPRESYHRRLTGNEAEGTLALADEVLHPEWARVEVLGEDAGL